MGSLPVRFHLIARRRRPRCVRGAHHAWPRFLPLATTCVGDPQGKVLSQATAVRLILSDLPSRWWKRLSGSRKLISISIKFYWNMLGKWAARGEKAGLPRSVFTAWIHQLSSAVRNGINQLQPGRLICQLRHKLITERIDAVILVTVCGGGLPPSKERRWHQPVMVQP